MSPARITLRRWDDRTLVVSPHGEIDVATAPTLQSALENALTGTESDLVICDLADLTFIDCAAINALLCVHGLAAQHNRCFAVAAAHGIVRKAFSLLQICDQVPCYDTVEVAAASTRSRETFGDG